MTKGVNSLIICGQGLAFEMAIAALLYKLPSSINITALEVSNCEIIDPFYGHVTSPDSIPFNRTLGIEEPEFLLKTDASFSYGTQYKNWAGKEWVQCHHLPFPVWENVPFIHYLTRSQQTLEPYLVTAECGKAKAFAHPPADKKVPLSRAEYGYQIEPNSLAKFFAARTQSKNVERLKGELKSVNTQDGRITSLTLEDGRQLKSDVFIDATGQSGALMQALENPFQSHTKICGIQQTTTLNTPLQSLRYVEGQDYGWQSQSTIRGQKVTLKVYHPETKNLNSDLTDNVSVEETFEANIGRRADGWSGNCVALGHASHIIDPLTPAPMMLLERDILRLLSLIPVSSDMTIEAREFNRLRQDDLDHADMFHRSFFETIDSPHTPYWQAEKFLDIPPKLKRKIDQFESRGFLTNYDLDPFNEQDWAIQHFGMGRKPRRYDVFIERLSQNTIDQNLDHMRQSIQAMALKVPPQDRYLTKFIQYLEKKNYAAQY